MLGIQIHLQIGFIIQFLSSRCIKKGVEDGLYLLHLHRSAAPLCQGRSGFHALTVLERWPDDSCRHPRWFRHGPQLHHISIKPVPCAPVPLDSATVRAKMAAVPTAVPTTAVPGVIGTPCWSLKCRLYQRWAVPFPERRALIADSTSRIWSCALTENVRRRKDHQIDLCKSWTSFRLVRSIIIN